MKLTKDDFYKDSASQGIWFYKCSADFTEEWISEILKTQEDAELWNQTLEDTTPNEIVERLKDWRKSEQKSLDKHGGHLIMTLNHYQKILGEEK